MPNATARRIYDADRVDARTEVITALMRPDAFNLNRLRITNLRRPGTLDALLELLTGVTHENYVGLESGVPYRSYYGRLPSGLPIEVIVDLEDQALREAS
jgi:hypothetical protein